MSQRDEMLQQWMWSCLPVCCPPGEYESVKSCPRGWTAAQWTLLGRQMLTCPRHTDVWVAPKEMGWKQMAEPLAALSKALF